MPDALVPQPAGGRVFGATRRVRLGDASPGGRLRFDAVARYLHDVSDDDTRDAGIDDLAGWVVRRTVIEVERAPVYLEPLTLRTWCSGTGGRWAERRVSIAGVAGGSVESGTLWVHLDPLTMRPTSLPDSFHEVFGPSTLGRRVRATLHHDDPPAAGASSAPWPLRFTDFDVMNHVNNAISWAAVEEQLARRRDLRPPMRAEVEHRAAIDPGDEITMLWCDTDGALAMWLVAADGTCRSTATVSTGTEHAS